MCGGAQVKSVYLRGGCVYGPLTGELLNPTMRSWPTWLLVMTGGWACSVTAWLRCAVGGDLTERSRSAPPGCRVGRCASGRHDAHLCDWEPVEPFATMVNAGARLRRIVSSGTPKKRHLGRGPRTSPRPSLMSLRTGDAMDCHPGFASYAWTGMGHLTQNIGLYIPF